MSDEALRLREKEHLSYAQIAKRLGYSTQLKAKKAVEAARAERKAKR